MIPQEVYQVLSTTRYELIVDRYAAGLLSSLITHNCSNVKSENKITVKLMKSHIPYILSTIEYNGIDTMEDFEDVIELKLGDKVIIESDKPIDIALYINPLSTISKTKGEK